MAPATGKFLQPWPAASTPEVRPRCLVCSRLARQAGKATWLLCPDGEDLCGWDPQWPNFTQPGLASFHNLKAPLPLGSGTTVQDVPTPHPATLSRTSHSVYSWIPYEALAFLASSTVSFLHRSWLGSLRKLALCCPAVGGGGGDHT